MHLPKSKLIAIAVKYLQSQIVEDPCQSVKVST